MKNDLSLETKLTIRGMGTGAWKGGSYTIALTPLQYRSHMPGSGVVLLCPKSSNQDRQILITMFQITQ